MLPLASPPPSLKQNFSRLSVLPPLPLPPSPLPLHPSLYKTTCHAVSNSGGSNVSGSGMNGSNTAMKLGRELKAIARLQMLEMKRERHLISHQYQRAHGKRKLKKKVG